MYSDAYFQDKNKQSTKKYTISQGVFYKIDIEKNTQFTLVNRVFSFIQSVIILQIAWPVPMHYLANHLLQCLPKCLRQAEW